MRKLLVITLLTACNPVPEIICEYSYEAAGMTVCSEVEMAPGAPAQLEHIVQIVQEEVHRHYPGVPDITALLAQHGTLVGVGRVWYVADCRELEGSGVLLCRWKSNALYSHTSNVIYLRTHSNGCFDGLIAHEILHSVVYHAVAGQPDQKHDTPWIWGDGTGETIEERIRARVNRDTLPLCVETKNNFTPVHFSTGQKISGGVHLNHGQDNNNGDGNDDMDL